MATFRTLAGVGLSLNECASNYGSNMHASSLADWVEYSALKGYVAPWQSVREFMREAGVPSALIDTDYDDEGFVNEDLFDEGEALARRDGDLALRSGSIERGTQETARQMIQRRIRYLGASYPFELDDFNRLRLRENIDVENNAYLIYLRISIMKGWLYPANTAILRPITNLFEQAVAVSMKNAGLQAAIVGTSEHGSFESKLRDCAQSLGVDYDPDSVRHSPYAKDEGVDIIGGCLAQDHRIGEPLWLVQAACGKSSSDWESKLMHIDPGKWARYLRSQSNPYAFLAVPYHLTDSAIDGFMHYSDTRSFLDRLRLVHLAGSSISLGEAALKMADKVFEIEMAWWKDDVWNYA